MKLADNIYTDIEKNKKFLRKLDRIAKGKPAGPFYIVTYPVFSYGLLEIYEYNELLQPYYRTLGDQIVVLGISGSREGAKQLVCDILEDHLDPEGRLTWP